MADQALLEQTNSVIPQTEVHFASRDFAWIQDQQNGQYSSGQIQYDTIGVDLSGKYVDPAKSFIAIRHKVTFDRERACDLGHAKPVIPKNGFPFLSSCLVNVDNKAITNNSNNLNMVANFRLLSSWSAEKQKNAGAIFMYAPDDTPIALRNLDIAAGAITPSGNYGSNSFVQDAAADETATGLPGDFNSGASERASYIYDYTNSSVDVNVAGHAHADMYSTGGSATIANIQAPVYSLAPRPAVLPAPANECFVEFTLLYPLPVLSDFFAKCGLIKSRIQIQLTLQSVTATGVPGDNPLVTLGNNSDTCPIMVENRACVGGAFASNTFTNYRTSISGPTYAYLRTVVLTPEQESAVPRERMVTYRDYNRFDNVIPGGGPASNRVDINWLVTTGIPRLREIALYKFFAGSSNGQDIRASLQTAEPAQSSPAITLSNTQLYIGSKPISQQNQRYVWEYYMQNVANMPWLSGSDPVVSSCPQYNYRDFLTSGIDYWDLTKLNLQEAELNNTQVQLQSTIVRPGSTTNNTSVAVRLIALVFFDRIVRISANGQLEVVAA